MGEPQITTGQRVWISESLFLLAGGTDESFALTRQEASSAGVV